MGLMKDGSISMTSEAVGLFILESKYTDEKFRELNSLKY